MGVIEKEEKKEMRNEGGRRGKKNDRGKWGERENREKEREKIVK